MPSRTSIVRHSGGPQALVLKFVAASPAARPSAWLSCSVTPNQLVERTLDRALPSLPLRSLAVKRRLPTTRLG